MSVADSHVVVVGASLAGTRAVEALRHQGFDGRITLIGDEAHQPYDRPPLSKTLLAGKRTADQVRLHPDGDDYASVLDVTMMLGRRACSLDVDAAEITLDGDERVGFDALVIATGSRARHLDHTDHLPNVYVVRTLGDCLRLQAALVVGARVVVVGAGFIGAEVAATAHSLGCHVTVLEAAPVPLERQLGAIMGTYCATVHARHGVPLRVGVQVDEIDANGVILAGGERIEADVVVVGVGAVPNTEWLQDSDVAVGDGVLCDPFCRVRGSGAGTLEGIVAAGDVARWTNTLFGEEMRIEHWTNAAEMAEHAATTLLADLNGDSTSLVPFAPVPYFWSDQYDIKIQFLGRSTGHQEVVVVDGSMESGKLVALYRRDNQLIGALGISRVRQLMSYRNLLATGASWEEALTHAAQ